MITWTPIEKRVISIMERNRSKSVAYICTVCGASVTEQQQADMPEWRSVNLEVCLNDECVSKKIARLVQFLKEAEIAVAEWKKVRKALA